MVLRHLGWVVVFVLLLAGGTLLARHLRNQRLEHLYLTATSQMAGDSEQIGAVKELSKYNDAKSGALLLTIAVAKQQLINQAAREAAIRELLKRKGNEYSSGLATLIQPHEGLSIRKLATEVLSQNGCSPSCVAEILHYKERLWRGELRYEDRLPTMVDILRRDQVSVESQLDSILMRNEASTLSVLREIYGLGSSAPSPFALAIVTRLHIASACQDIINSHKVLEDIPTYKEPDEMSKAITELGCR